MKAKSSTIGLMAAALMIVAFFVPLGELPMNGTVTAWALLCGMLQGGTWPPLRIALAVVFLAALSLLLGTLLLKILQLSSASTSGHRK